MTEPDATEIKAYYDRQKTRGSQPQLDSWMLDMYLQENLISARPPDKAGTRVERVKAGLAGLTVDQDTNVLSGEKRAHVTSRGNDEHAEKLEAFIDGSMHVMEEEDPVTDPATQDLRIFGRCASLGPVQDPKLWGDEELKKLVDEMNEAGDAETYKEKDKAVEAFKRDNFPIVWQHIPADSFFPTFKRGRELSKSLGVKKMYRDDVEAEFGEILDARDKKTEEIEVLEYADEYVLKTVLNTSTPKEVRRWEHGMRVGGKRVVPVAFEEVDRLPANNKGWVWKGALFHVRGGLEAIDETLTDIFTNIHEHTTTGTFTKLNPALRTGVDGWPREVRVGAGINTELLINEDIGRVPVPQITEQTFSFLALMKGLVDQVATNRPALQGTGPSGQSAVNLATSNAIGKAELKRSHRALNRWLTKSARLAFASVVALNKSFPDIPDKVTVRSATRRLEERSKEIAVTPADVKDYFHLVTVTVSLNLPVNQGADAQTASVLVQAGLADELTARELILNWENPMEVEERRAKIKLMRSTVAVLNAIQLQRMTASAQAGTIPVAELIQKSFSITQAAQQALVMALEEDGEDISAFTGVPSPGRSLNNQAEAGRVSQMSELQGMGLQ